MTTMPDYARAARMAAMTLQRFAVQRLPVNPAALLRQIPYVKLMEDCPAEESFPVLGATISAGGHTLVVIRQDQAPEQRQFTLAHELGHIALRHTGTDRSWAQEEEANCFAFHLLVPAPVFARVMRSRETVYAEQVARLCFLPWRRVLQGQKYAFGLDPELYGQLENQLSPVLEELTLPSLYATDRAHRINKAYAPKDS